MHLDYGYIICKENFILRLPLPVIIICRSDMIHLAIKNPAILSVDSANGFLRDQPRLVSRGKGHNLYVVLISAR